VSSQARFERDRLPYYDRVPKTYLDNLRYRKKVVELGYESESAAEELWIACARDPLFWVNTFGYTYDPRRPSSAQPFITYGYQDDLIIQICNALGTEDLVFPKSRDMGLTWLCLLGIGHSFQFEEEKSFMLASRKEDLVDKTDDPDALMWKLDYLFDKQPGFLRPIVNRTNLHMGNEKNDSVIDGESTNGDLGRGGRRTALMLDEIAAVQNAYAVLKATRDNTPCRLMPSTPQGAANAFFDVAHDPGRKVVRVHWSLHPVKAHELYFDHKGKPRSPWYDNECKRAGNEREIAQELDIDFHGSDFSFFKAELVEQLLDNEHGTVMPPFMTGNLIYDKETCEPIKFQENENGLLKLWFYLYGDQPPPGNDIAFGIDTALGSRDSKGIGASNSTITAIDLVTGEQLMAVAVNGEQPSDFARLVVALARWFFVPSQEGPLLVPEANGAGKLLIDKVDEYGYSRMYMRQIEDKQTKDVTQKPGWWSTTDTKRTLLGELSENLNLGNLVIRDKQTIQEMRLYRHEKGGKIVHSRSEDTDELDEARENHGDRVIGAACANLALQRKLGDDTNVSEPKSGLTVRSMAGRQAARAAAERATRNRPRRSRRRRGLDRTPGLRRY
jgi:hypothetical protein